jgi:hypothetical protein
MWQILRHGLMDVVGTRPTSAKLCVVLTVLIGGMAQYATAAPLVAPSAASSNIVTREATQVDLDRSEINILSHPIQRERSGRVSVMIVGRKTVAPRTTDTLAYARRYRQWSVAAAVALRGAEDLHFTAKANSLAQRLEELNGFASPPQVATVTTGADFLAALVAASRQGPITNVAIYGHAAPDALYMMEDRGFYAAVSSVAKATALATGTDDEKVAKLRELGARDLSDLAALVESGAIRFAKNAVIVFTGCAVAGKRDIELTGIAAQVAEITNATTIASIDVTDQSMLFGRNVLDVFYSRGTWVRFIKQANPERLNIKLIEVLKYMNVDDGAVATIPEPTEPAAPVWDRFHCAMRSMPGFGLCADRASNGDTIAELRKGRAVDAVDLIAVR